MRSNSGLPVRSPMRRLPLICSYFLVNENKAALRCMSRILAHDPKYDSLVFDSYVHSGAPAPDEAEGRGGTWHGRPARVKPFSTLTRSASTARAVPVRHGFSSYF